MVLSVSCVELLKCPAECNLFSCVELLKFPVHPLFSVSLTWYL